MIKSRLNIDGVDVGFTDLLSVSMNYLIADVRDINSRNADYSKTITIPATEEVNRLFEFIFEINIELNSFNPNVKTPATYLVNEIPVFKGDLQILKIVKMEINGVWEVYYECFLLGTNSNLFLEIGDSLLTDLDFSDLDHTFNNSADKYTPAAWGTGYYYGFIDYGCAGGNTSTWYFDYLKPAIFAKEYVDRIFLAAGKTYTSNYFNSDYFKHLVIPDVNSGALQYDKTTIQNSQFYAGASTDFPGTPLAGVEPYTTNGTWGYTYPSLEIIIPITIDDDSTGQWNDPGNVFNTSTSIFTAGVSGWYQVVCTFNGACTISAPATAEHINTGNIGYIDLNIERSTDGGSTWAVMATATYAIEGADFTPIGSPVSDFYNDFNFQVSHASLFCAANHKVRATLKQNSALVAQFSDNLLAPVLSGSSSILFTTLANSELYANLNPANVQYNETVVMSTTIPRNVKQIDFLTSLFRIDNLYIEQDKTNPNNYLIEPREDFYTGSYLDWTYKVDISQPIEVVPMGELDFKKFLFQYKEDSDHYNKKYQDEYSEPYGSWDVTVTNDFIKQIKKTEIIFSATPGVGNYSNSIVAPVFAKLNGTTYEPTACNIRILYAAGLIDCSAYNFSVNGASSVFNQYPYIGHLDDPYNPTIDLCWGQPYKIYWKFPQQNYTDNNRYNERYSKYIAEIIDQNSKIIRCKAVLTEFDIYSFSFTKTVFIRDAYYYVNKIENYDPQIESTCDIELLKLKTGPTFSPSATLIDEVGGGSARVMQSVMPGGDLSGNSTLPGSLTIGSNNNNGGSGSIIIGEGNVIPTEIG